MADLAEERKSAKYIRLGPGDSFTLVAIETLGAIGKKMLASLKKLGHRVRLCTGEVKAMAYLLQHLFELRRKRMQLLCWDQ